MGKGRTRAIGCAFVAGFWAAAFGCGTSDSAAPPEGSCDGATCTSADGGPDGAGPAGDGSADGACTKTHLDCDGNPGNGCETPVDSDPKNCGACGHDCLGGGCAAGLCRPVELYVIPSATAQVNTPTAIAVDATSIYVGVLDTRASSNGGSILKLPIAGGAAQTLLASMPYAPSDLVVDGATLYFGTPGGSSSSTPGSVQRMPIGGGAATVIAATTGYRIVLDASFIYWSDNFGSVVRASRDRVELDAGPGADAGAITRLGSAAAPQGIAVDSTSVYWAASGGDIVERAPLGGGNAVVLGSVNTPKELKVTATDLYVSGVYGSNGPGLRRIPLGVGSGVQYGTAGATDFAIDGAFIYWLENYGDNRVLKAPLAGGTPSVLSGDKFPVGRIAIDAKAIYFTVPAGAAEGKVMKLAK
jgi:hypothetical protein